MRVAITGASGSLGRYVVNEFLENGHEIFALDRIPPVREKIPYRIIDIRDLGQVCGALHGCDGVVHLAALPSPVGNPPETVFNINVQGTFNVLEAAAILGISRVVSISSCSALGVAWAYRPVSLQYVPVDEAHSLVPQDAYGLSKQVGEDICRAFHRRTGGNAVSLRFPLIWDSAARPNFLAEYSKDELAARHTLWSYIDIRDAARACRLALETPDLGAEALYVTAPETFMTRPSAALARQYFPAPLEIRADETGFWSLHDCSRAARLLGFKAEHVFAPLAR